MAKILERADSKVLAVGLGGRHAGWLGPDEDFECLLIKATSALGNDRQFLLNIYHFRTIIKSGSRKRT